jgi:hypothetical protein
MSGERPVSFHRDRPRAEGSRQRAGRACIAVRALGLPTGLALLVRAAGGALAATRGCDAAGAALGRRSLDLAAGAEGDARTVDAPDVRRVDVQLRPHSMDASDL